jgi:hypothetical protein
MVVVGDEGVWYLGIWFRKSLRMPYKYLGVSVTHAFLLKMWYAYTLMHSASSFFRMKQYNADAHNTHPHSPLWIHVRKPYPYERTVQAVWLEPFQAAYWCASQTEVAFVVPVRATAGLSRLYSLV